MRFSGLGLCQTNNAYGGNSEYSACDIIMVIGLWYVSMAFFYDKMESTDQSFKDIKAILKESGTVKDGDLIVNIASMPIQERGFTNMLKISAIS